MKEVKIPKNIKTIDFNFNRNRLLEDMLNDQYFYFSVGNFDILNKKSIKNFDDLFVNIVGDVAFLRLSKNNSKLSLVLSMSSSGYFYLYDNEKLLLFSDENVAYKYLIRNRKFNLNYNEFVSLIISHQLCWSSPFGSLDNSLFYLPSGMEFLINKKFENKLNIKMLDVYDNLYKNKKSKNFILNLKKVLYSYSKIYKGELNLLFSGGIDSTLLWKIISQFKPNLKCLNVEYPSPTSGKKQTNINLESKMIDNVSKKLGISVDKIKSSYDDVHILFNACKLSPRILISITQLKLNTLSLGNNFSYSDKNKLILISGQNADTLHSMDTYSPSTEMTFPIRQAYNIISIYRRFFYNFFLVKLFYIFPNSLSIFLKLTNIDSLKEHDKGTNHYLINLDKKYKKDFFLKRKYLFDINNFVNIDNQKSLSSINRELLIRIFRHFRTIQNSIRTFGDYSKICSYQLKKMPFIESPVYFSLLTYKRGVLDIFYPKRLIYRAFKELFNFEYRKLIKKASLKVFFTTISDIYQIKTKKTILLDENDYFSLLDFIKYVNQKYPFNFSNFKELIKRNMFSEIIINEIFAIIQDLETISNLENKIAIDRLKKLSSKLNIKFILRLLNLYIYLNYIFEEETI